MSRCPPTLRAGDARQNPRECTGRRRIAPRARRLAGIALLSAAFDGLTSPVGHAAVVTALRFASSSSATATVGVPFTFDPYARNIGAIQLGTPFYEVSGRLPAGVQSSPLVGIIGTPAPGSEGTYPLTFYAAELGATSAEQHFTLVVRSGPAPSQIPPLTPAVVNPTSAAAPARVSYAGHSDAHVLDNDTLGDCVEAAEAHLAEDQALAVGERAPRITTRSILSSYYTLTGGAAGPTVGTNDEQAFALWKTKGLGKSRLVAVSQLADPHSRLELERAVDQLGGVLAYVQVPSIDKPAGSGGTAHVWQASAATARGAKLPHELAVVGYDPTGPLLSTWGHVQQATWSWWSSYAVGVYPVITQALVTAGHGPSGIPIATLLRTWSGTPGTAPSAPSPSLSY